MRPLIATLSCVMLLFFATNSKAAVIIQYHHVDDSTPPSTSITPDTFTEHIEYLAARHFNILPLHQIVGALKQGESLPDKTIAITFDDGYESVFSNALPILKKYHYPFTVFVNPTLVGSKGYMSWDALRELTRYGADVANHTLTHPHLVRSHDGESEKAWQARIMNEIIDAETAIQNETGDSYRLLAYPYGEFDDRVEKIAANLGYVGFAQHSGAFDSSVDWQKVPRFAFGGIYSNIESFKEKVNSLPMPLLEIEVRDPRGYSLQDPLLPLTTSNPILKLKLASSLIARNVQCFASGQGRIEVEKTGNEISTQPERDLPIGRSRINCTAPSDQKGRFYWYSHFFMRKLQDGSWYPEE